MKLLIATSNPGKFNEIAEILKELELELLTPKDLNIDEEVAETGNSYEENARIKALHYFSKTGIPTIGEDSGIIVNALKNELGIHTRRWGAGEDATDEEWLTHFMKTMSDYSDKNAKFISHMCLITQDSEHHFYGETIGEITHEIEAPLFKGLPLSSVFKPVGFEKVYSALAESEKNTISHRGKAGKQLRDHLLLIKIRKKIGQLPHENFWQIGPSTGLLLRETVKDMNVKNVLEIGTSAGYSALWVIEGLAITNGKLYTVESNKERFEIAKQNFKEAKVENYVEQVFGHAPEALENIPIKKWDMAFFDATKSETIQFFKFIWSRLNANGIIIVDNLNTHRKDFKPFIDYLTTENIEFKLEDIDNGLLIIKILQSTI